MNKRLVCLLMSFVLLLSMAMPVYAEPSEETEPVKLSISSPEEFLTFARNCRLDTYSQNLQVSLETDLDFTDSDFISVPIFSGTFLGNGHSVQGIHLSNDGSREGLFRHLTETAVVTDLKVSGQIHPGGSGGEIGGIAGRSEGQILNCSFSGELSGGDCVGGIAGSNGVTGLIESCTTEGQIYGKHFVGGITGENAGVVRDCTNAAGVNTTPQQNTVELSDITLENLTNTEAVNTVTDIGGIAGISSGVIRGCINQETVGYPHMGYNIGGIAGTQSGYIAACQNQGAVRGRKEVGGIVGQMEPVSLIEYTEDTLQILQGQLDSMTGLVNRASGNARANAAGIGSQIDTLQQQTDTAKEAVKSLIPDKEDPTLPDKDTLLAAQNTLTSSLSSMPGTIRGIASATQATVSTLSRDLNAITNQVTAMSQTIGDASENLGGTITDISDQDTPEMLTGKVEGCINMGDVLADLNAGGIAGAISPENDLDLLEDWEEIGQESLNLHGQLRGVILNSENSGTVSAKRQNVGGIVGWQLLGLVKDSLNTGTLDAAEADCVGGVSGLSTGFIRSSYAKCAIDGKTNVGGIAGSATVLSDCVSQVVIESTREKKGAIAGVVKDGQTDVEDPVRNNFYLPVGEDMGAVDGVSYSGLAEPMEQDAFLRLEQLPETFRTVKIRFLFEDGTVRTQVLEPGQSLTWIPEVPQKAGYFGSWDGLEEANLTNILFDMTFRTQYRAHNAVIASAETREGRTLFLLEGDFSDGTVISAEKTEAVVVLLDGEILLETWNLTMEEPGTTARFLLPADADPQRILALLGDGKGNWKTAPSEVDGSYLVFSPEADTCQLALIQTAQDHTAWWIAGIGGAVLITLLVVLIIRSKKKKATVQA